MTQWDFQNKGMLGWTGTSSFVLEVPLRHLRPSVIYSVPCDQILQRAHCKIFFSSIFVVFLLLVACCCSECLCRGVGVPA